MAKILGNNPLLKPEPRVDEAGFTEKDLQTIRETQTDADDFTTASFKIRKTHLKKLRDYAFTNRLEIKEALDEALAQYLDPIDESTLMEYPEKPKKTRKKRG